MTNGAKPNRADICIIGAGAPGAAAAKVLTERGMRVVMLERGPWRTRETFGGDELANINRYNLWPDPLLNPRTVRDEVGGEFRTELFCPVPQMVGGGTVHWQGWLPRFTESDFRLHSIVGDVPGRRWSTGRSPMTSSRATTPRWSGRSVSRAALVRTATSLGAARTIRARRCPSRAMRRSSTRDARNSVTTRSRLRKRRCPGLTTAGRRLSSVPSPSNTETRPALAPAPSTCSCPSAGHRSPRPATQHLRLRDRRRRAGSGEECGVPRRGGHHVRAGGRRSHSGRGGGWPGCCCSKARASPTVSPTAATWSDAMSHSTSTAPLSGPSKTRSSPGPAAATSAPAVSNSTGTMTAAGSPAAATSPCGRRHPAAYQLVAAQPPGLGSRRQAGRPRLL